MNLFQRRPKLAAVLGCGPAGLFAAHALIERGWDVEIFSRKRKSEMFGAQFLHKPIPGLSTSPPRDIQYMLIGSPDQYRQKVYGQRAVSVSPEEIPIVLQAWDIREAYNNAWERYAGLIHNVPEIGPEWVGRRHAAGRHKVTLSSLPAPALCWADRDHVFDSQLIWAIGDAPERGTFCPVPCTPFSAVLDGTPAVGWYRVCNVFGYTTAEWPSYRKPPFEGVAQVTKPIRTDCDCWPDIIPIGRYGTWTKGYLSHQAYETAAKL